MDLTDWAGTTWAPGSRACASQILGNRIPGYALVLPERAFGTCTSISVVV